MTHINYSMKKSFQKKDYEITQREILYQGRFRLVKLHLRHRLFNGEWSKIFSREILERLSAAAVLPYDPILDRVVLIEQFRPGALADPVNPWQIEIPAGIIDTQESPAEVAVREAQEEAGCNTSQLELITDYFVSPGGSNEYIHVYCGQVDATHAEGIHGLQHENEDIHVLNISSEEAFELVRQREIKNAPAIIALQWLEINQEILREKWLAPNIG